jgi:hypothetical protein
MLRYIPYPPEEGTMTLGVVYYISHERKINNITGFAPIGYVIEEKEEEEDKE